ncbi:PREDICTED: uncharacterized protein LOC109242038 [Nicotiana attenuata]|uniref:uncharacterized protein LOC109242038 n=1 Tax=Nicotiana attenuata TaxID=49451 RepID=UPI000904ED3E|nr:PREDICTED: uncharacterized protein LOC109242038 [Nicotiana attenuata]
MENYTPRLKYDKVVWEFPMEGWIKVNTDGASRGNPGRSSIGFCLRDASGEVKYAMGREITEGSNNEAEAVAILEALRICRILNYSHIWLQTDSMLMKNSIEGTWKPPWFLTALFNLSILTAVFIVTVSQEEKDELLHEDGDFRM